MAGDIFKRRKMEKYARRYEDRYRNEQRDNPSPSGAREDWDYKQGRNKRITTGREKLATANDVVSKLVRYGDKDDRRTNWSDLYDDDGKIRWSTSSERGSRERKQERKTMRFLERQTGLDFKRTNENSGKSEIHIDRYGDKSYMNQYKGNAWYDNMGFKPVGLHHWEQDGDRKYSRIEAPTKDFIRGESQHILSHEIGHALGLTDLLNNKDQNTAAGYSVMSYNSPYRAAKGPVRFGKSDINAIKMNYGLS